MAAQHRVKLAVDEKVQIEVRLLLFLYLFHASDILSKHLESNGMDIDVSNVDTPDHSDDMSLSVVIFFIYSKPSFIHSGVFSVIMAETSSLVMRQVVVKHYAIDALFFRQVCQTWIW